MTVYVLSTMSMGVNYCFWEHKNRNANATHQNPVVGDVPVCKKKVHIHGGAGLPSLKSGFGEMSRDVEGHPIWTADGIVTPVKDADYEFLKDNPVFQKHLARGLVKVLKSDITQNHKAVAKEAASMAADPFAVMTPEKLKKMQAHKIKVTTGKADSDNDFRI